MTLDEIKQYFGNGYQFFRKTGMAHTNYIHWHRKGYVPILTQNRLEKLTKGALISRYSDGEGGKDAIKE